MGHLKEHGYTFIKGVAMGAANVIPGVSGGTIAFITGIYERLINAVKSFDLDTIKLLFVGDWKVFTLKTDLYFLIAIFLGIGVSIISLAKGLELAFTHYESLTLAFFFGLIIASIIGVGRQIEGINLANVISLIVGTGIAVLIAFLPPAQANDSFIYLTVCGMVAISSMILPGLSGSYVLLLMGNYILVMQAISSLNVGVLAPVAIGCILGLVLFSRLLSYLFKNFKSQTVSILTGFVAGSLVIIWPWKVTNYITLANGKEKATGYEWIVPELNSEFIIAIGLAITGFLMVWGMEKMAAPIQHSDK